MCYKTGHSICSLHFETISLMETKTEIIIRIPFEGFRPVHGLGGSSLKATALFPSLFNLIFLPFRSRYYEKFTPFLSIECEK